MNRRRTIGLVGRVAGRTVGRTIILLAVMTSIAALVVGACSSDEPGSASRSRDEARAAPADTVPLDAPTQAELATAAGLTYPEGTADFLTAQLDNRRQLDATFTFPTAARAAFLEGSNLTLADDERVVTHSSPLWKLNPGTPISGAIDTVTRPEGIELQRAIELTEEGPDRTRVRLVITPAG